MIRWTLASILLTASCIETHPAVPQRIGLVFGIENYKKVPHLSNATDDANAVYDAIRRIGFSVKKFKDLTWQEMDNELAFFKSLIKPGDIVFFYFAGHGFEKANKRYLVPADMLRYHPTQVDDAIADSFAVDEIRDEFRSRGAQLVVAVIDACRRDPFVNAPAIVTPPQRPLRIKITDPTRRTERVRAQQHKFFEFYSTSSGRAALDRLGYDDPENNSVFTRYFIKMLKKSQLPFPKLASYVAGRVEQLTSTFGPDSTQLPTIEANFFTDFSLGAPTGPQLPELPPPSDQLGASEPEARSRCDELASSPDDEQYRSRQRGVQRMFLDFAAAIPACQTAASFGDPDGRVHYQLGRAYHAAGKLDEARSAYNYAERLNYSAALTALGEISFKEKEGSYPSVREAWNYFQRAAPRSARAETFMGVMYIYKQIRVSMISSNDDDFNEGKQLLLKANSHKDPDAAFWLGRIYHQYKIDGEQSYNVAERYYHMAERQGSRRALLYLGNLARDRPPYLGRERTMQDYWLKAAHLGSSQAAYNLGEYYEGKIGGVDGRSQACSYYDQAAQMGHPPAWSAYVRLCAGLTAENSRTKRQ